MSGSKRPFKIQVELERNATPIVEQVSSNAVDKPKKAAKKKKRKAKTSVVGNAVGDVQAAPDDLNISTDNLASTPAEDVMNVDDNDLDPSTLWGMVMSLREEMEVERAERKKELEVERAERKKELEVERAARLQLEIVVQTEKGEKQKLLAEQQTLRNQIAAEKFERLDQLGEVENRTVELEGWVSTQDPKFLDRIRLRTLLDNGQSVLARFIGCNTDGDVSGASMAWRTKLNGTNGQRRSDEERLRAAHDLLSAQKRIPEPVRKLMGDNNAMRLLTQKFSIIRRQANDVAHRLVDSRLLKEIAARSLNPTDKKGMLHILDFVDSYQV